MRDRPRTLLDSMRMRGGVTVDELASELRLTRTTIVNHLNSLMGEGLVQRGGLRCGRRRPSVVYKLTANADRIFPQLYDTFLSDILEELNARQPGKIKPVIRGVRDRWIARDLPAVKGLRGEHRITRALGVMTEHGFMPALEGPRRARVLQQYNCPLRRLCELYPDVRGLISRWIEALFGARVTRLGCSATGDAACSYILGRGVPSSKRSVKS